MASGDWGLRSLPAHLVASCGEQVGFLGLKMASMATEVGSVALLSAGQRGVP